SRAPAVQPPSVASRDLATPPAKSDAPGLPQKTAFPPTPSLPARPASSQGSRIAAWPCASSASSRDQDLRREIRRPSSGNGESQLANRELGRRRNHDWRLRTPRPPAAPSKEG